MYGQFQKNQAIRTIQIIQTIATFGLLSLSLSQAYGLTADEISSIVSAPPGRLAKINMNGGVVYETLAMDSLYQPRQYAPLWLFSAEAGKRLAVIRELLQMSSVHGFEAEDFWNPKMEAFFQYGSEMSEMEFELAVSEAIIRYTKAIHIGQVDPTTVDEDIKLTPKPFGPEEIEQLRKILEGPATDIATALEKFEPQIPLYQYLKSQLATRADQFSKDQLNKIIATMEKLRWFPHQLEDRHVFVNSAMTELRVVENGETVLSMKTVNGRPIRRTPMMIDLINRVEINPAWLVPFKLAIWDKLPHIQKDVSFLARHRLQVFSPGSKVPIRDVEAIPWHEFNRNYFPYQLKQLAGPSNVLGKVKFPLPESDGIYLHDTDERKLFKEASPRLRSSGCIRLEKPMELAAYVLKDQAVPSGEGWTQADGSEYPMDTTFTESILMSRVAKPGARMSSIQTVGIPVEKPLRLYVAYLTADRDEEGGVRFIKDHYKQDARLLSILKAKGRGTPEKATKVKVTSETLVPVSIRGELGPTQLFENVVAVRCRVWPYKGCVDVDAQGKESREEYHFKINETVKLPVGHYLLGAENTLWPGWLEVSCKQKNSGSSSGRCQQVTVNLEKIQIPEEMAQADEVFVYRDLTSKVEGNKILSQSFHNGQALLQETPVSAKNFYLPGSNQQDVVQRLNTDYCGAINAGQVHDVAPEVAEYCLSLSQVMGMAEYVELPVVKRNDREEGTSVQGGTDKVMKVFQFPKDDAKGQASNQWVQVWVGAPGNWIEFRHRRYLVAAPLFPRNISPEKRFVSVLPGQYRLLAVTSAGDRVGQAVVRTENIDENYERIARKVVLGEE